MGEDSRSIANSVVQIDASQMRSGRMRQKSTIIADPVPEELSAAEDETPPWRPSEPHIVQLEMNSQTSFDVYYFDKDGQGMVRQFAHEAGVIAFLKSLIRPRMTDRGNSKLADFDAEQLADRAMTLAHNFRVANINLETLLTHDVTKEMIASGRDLTPLRGFLR